MANPAAYVRAGTGRAKAHPVRVKSFGRGIGPDSGRAQYLTASLSAGSDYQEVHLWFKPETVDKLLDGWEHTPARFRDRKLFVRVQDMMPGDRICWNESYHVSGKDNWQIQKFAGTVRKAEHREGGYSHIHWEEPGLHSCKWRPSDTFELMVKPSV